MKRILSLILTAAMLFSMIAVSVSAGIDHADVTNENKNVFSAKLSQDTLMPGDTFTLKVSADSFWGDQSLTTEDPDLGTATGAYGPAIFTVGAVFDNSVIKASKAPTLATDSTIGNGEYMQAQMPTKAVMNNTGIGTVMVTASQIINDDEDGYITFYGSGDVVTFNFEIAEDALPGTYYIYLGDYMAGTEDKHDEVVGGKYVRYNAAVDPYATKLDRALSEYPAPIAVKVGSDASEEDLAAAAAVDTLIANIGTILYKEKQLIELQEQYVRFDSVNHQNNYMHVGSIPFNTGTGFVEIEFYPNEGCNPEFNFGFIGGTTNADNGQPCLFYNTGTKTFMLAGLDGWVNPSQVWPGELFAESEPVIAEDGEFIKAAFIYDDGYVCVEANGEIVLEYEISISTSFYIFYPTWADFYLKSMTLNDGLSEVSVDGTDLSAVGSFFGQPGSATLTLENFKFYADSTKKLLEAEAAYAALTDLQKALVSKAADLFAARELYDTLAGEYTDKLIDAIGTVKFNPIDSTKDSLAAIVAAEEAYAELTDAQKANVTKLDVLTAARERWNTLNAANDAACAADVDTLINAIGEVNFNSRTAIETARAAYEALTDAQKALVTELATLVAAEETFAVYGPIMTAEAAILAIKPFMQSKNAMFLSYCQGYSNMVDENNQSIGNGAACVRDFNMNFDFMYTSYTESKHPIVGLTLNGVNVGYDVKCQKFSIGPGGFGAAANDGEQYATYDYALAPYEWVNMGVTTTVDGDVYLYVNDELVCEAHGVSVSFNLFWMSDIELYMANFTADATFANEMGDFKPAVVDLYNLNDQTVLVDAARVAVDALNDEQLELLGADLIAILEAAEAELAELEAELKADAADVDSLIDAIVDAETYAAANAAFEAMYPSAKQYLTKTEDLKNAAITVVEDAIAAIGDVTLDSLAAIEAAEQAFAALSAAQKAEVENADVLTAARAAYSALKAAAMDEIIAALGSADAITLESIDAIVAAEQAYAALSDAEKALVTKKADLDACRNAYSALRAAAVDALIDAIGEVTLESGEAISIAEQAYNGLSNAEKAFVTKKADLDAAKAALVSLSTGHNNVINLINSLYYGGTGVKVNFNGNTYTQLDPNPGTLDFTFAYAMMNPAAQADGESHTVGGGIDNGVWAGYDVDRQAFVIYKDFNLFGDGDYGTNDAYVVASYPMTLAADTWYFVELNFSVNGVSIVVDGVEVVATDAATIDGDGSWFIYYPRNVVGYYDAFVYTLDGAVMETVTDWNSPSTMYWIGHDGGNWSVTSGLVEATASEALVAKVAAMYDALTDVQKSLVTNYDKLAALMPQDDPAQDVQDAIDDLGDFVVDVDDLTVLENADAIADAYAAYNALTAEEQANVDASGLFAALEAYNKALYYDAILNDKKVAPSITAVDNVDSILVSWDAIDNAACYWVFVDGVVVLRTTDTSAVVAAAAGEHTVKVQVAINNDADTLGAYGAYASGISEEAAVVVTAGFYAEVDEAETEAVVTWVEYKGAVLYYVKAIAADGSEIAIFKVTDLANLTITLPKLAAAYDVVVMAYVDGAFVYTAPVAVSAK